MAKALRDILKEEEKAEFTSGFSHELNILLTSMKNAGDIVLGEKAGEINGDQKRFHSLVDRTMVAISFAEAGKFETARDALTEMILICVQEGINRNPLTKLPGNGAIQKEINRRLQQKAKFAVCYLDIDHFKSFNDKYGYVKGDIVIQRTASIIQNVLERYGNKNDFIGHIGGDDFIFVTTPERVKRICQRIINFFDDFIPSVYDNKDRQNRYVESKDRQGNIYRFPLMSVSIGITTNITREFENHIHVGEIATEMKSLAKSLPGSCFEIDRRKR